MPPAWTGVWIAADPRGHLQATGRDARGRKQYRYHPDFRAHRERAKYDRLPAFAARLPRIRAAVDRDLALRGLPRRKVLALVVRLMELTLIRVGSEEYARLNKSFGLTTLRGRHASVEGTRLRFTFRGKSGRRHDVTVRDRRLATAVARCQELPGQELLQYLDPDGTPRAVRSEDVNDYLREISGADVTAKDFRTWAGTVLAFRALRSAAARGDAPDRRAVVEAVRHAADGLGNTPAVARASYVHPAVPAAFLEGRLAGRARNGTLDPAPDRGTVPAEVIAPVTTPDEEAALLALLRRELAGDAARGGAGPGRSGKDRAGGRRKAAGRA